MFSSPPRKLSLALMQVAATLQPQENHAVIGAFTKPLAKSLALSFALAFAAQPLLAQDRATLRDACARDIATLCPGVQPGGGRIAACFKENLSKLSEGCRTVLKTNASAAD